MTREELEKQILEILTRDRIGSHSPHKHLEDFAKEITSLIEQKPDCYPKSFIIWKDEHSDPVWHKDYPEHYHVDWLQYPNNEAITLDELFIYWQTNIKEK